MRQSETRQRIVEAALELHGSIGVAGTTITAVAERAGVERKTVYRHFADETVLAAACQALYFEQHPLPDPTAWLAREAAEDRLRAALGDLYPHYRQTGSMLELLIRDAPVSQIAAHGVQGMREYLAAAAAIVAGNDPRLEPGNRARVALGHALEFETWQSLTTRHGLDDATAATFSVDGVRDALAREVARPT